MKIFAAARQISWPPSVAMNAGIFVYAISAPWIAPDGDTHHHAEQDCHNRRYLHAEVCQRLCRQVHRLYQCTGHTRDQRRGCTDDRSIPRVRIANATPKAMIPLMDSPVSRVRRLAIVKNFPVDDTYKG